MKKMAKYNILLIASMSILIIFILAMSFNAVIANGYTIFLPLVAKDEIYEPTPTILSGKWHHYKITYSLKLDRFIGPTKIWMPLPVNGTTQQGINIFMISPLPTASFLEPKGNRIIYWEEEITAPGAVFSEQFEIFILEKEWVINPYETEYYAPDDIVLTKYLQPSTMIQSDHPEIIAAAQAIIGDETNPYYKTVLITDWLQKNLESGGQYEDALNVLRTRKYLACGSWAHLFVALCRAARVPARIVAGVAGIRPGIYNWYVQNFGTHLWEEIYLPKYGWVPMDVGGNLFAVSEGDRLILSRDSDIDLGYGRGIVPWFHMPHVNNMQEEQSDLILEVEFLGISDFPEN